jgi:squalene synthase HpnC
MRLHVAAVYAFARTADDIADEGTASPGERQAQLALWQDRIHQAAAVQGATVTAGAPDRDALIALALGHSIRSLDLPLTLFDDLLSAFGQDTMTTRYDSWDQVLDYCRRSANPIGRLVLRIAGYRDDALDRSSDALCTALQLTNFWQDFGRDWQAGRLYVPREELLAGGACEADLHAGRPGPAWDRVLARAIARTREHYAAGRGVCDGVAGRLRFELRMTWLGGACMLDRIDRMRDQLLVRRPTLDWRDGPMLVWRAARWT